jgi:transcriptional regulator, tetR family
MRYKMNKTHVKRNNIIKQSAKLFYYKGYKNTSVNDILKECKIPKGSFYYYFKSKNDVLMTVIEHHTDNLINFFNITVNDLSILKLKIFFENFFNNIELNKFHGGSPIGNLAIELSDINDEARIKLIESYKKIEQRISFFLGTLKQYHSEEYFEMEPELYARILVSLLEGTMLKIKTERNNSSIIDFLNFFDKIFKIS